MLRRVGAGGGGGGKVGEAMQLCSAGVGAQALPGMHFARALPGEMVPLSTCTEGPVAQWIRHRPTEPGIAGSSPAGVIECESVRACLKSIYYTTTCLRSV